MIRDNALKIRKQYRTTRVNAQNIHCRAYHDQFEEAKQDNSDGRVQSIEENLNGQYVTTFNMPRPSELGLLMMDD